MIAALARNGRLLLVASLLVGLALPRLGAWVAPALPWLIAVLLFLAALRVGPAGAVAGGSLRADVAWIFGFQLAAPLGVALVGVVSGMSHPGLLALVLVLASAPLAGSPNLALLSGGNPVPALRLLVLGTLLLPLTAFPVLAVLGVQGAIWEPVLRLLTLIAVAAVLALSVRPWLMRRADAAEAVDACSAVVMAVIVIGLMAASAEVLRQEPLRFLGWLGWAALVNFALQGLGALVAMRGGLRGAAVRPASDTVPLAIVAGNRNIALFLVALPPETTAPLMVFIGCYQIPMYLTPLIQKRLTQRYG